MNLKEEIKKLESLLAGGAITKEEFEHLQTQLMGVSKEKDEIPDKPTVDEPKEDNHLIGEAHKKELENAFKSYIKNSLNDLHLIIHDAGSKVRSSVTYAVVSYILLFVGFVMFYYGYFDYIIKVISGSRYYDESIKIMVFSGVLFIGSFICWVIQLSKLNKAGKLMEASKDFIYKDVMMEITPDPLITELKGLTIGQEHGGGIIISFDKSNLFAFIVAKKDLKTKQTLRKAFNICKILSHEGFNDWHLPTSSLLMGVHQNLQKFTSVGFLESEYWCSDFRKINFKNGKISYLANIELLEDEYITAIVRPIRIAPI